jgi:hypothetical protein
MGHMRLGHQQTVVANLRQHSSAGRAAMDGHKLSDVFALTDDVCEGSPLYFKS